MSKMSSANCKSCNWHTLCTKPLICLEVNGYEFHYKDESVGLEGKWTTIMGLCTIWLLVVCCASYQPW